MVAFSRLCGALSLLPPLHIQGAPTTTAATAACSDLREDCRDADSQWRMCESSDAWWYEQCRATCGRCLTPFDNSQALNLALGATLISSSKEGAAFTADKAADGDLATRWASTWSDNQWLVIDLGTPTLIDVVSITWESACAASYLLQGSMTGIFWTVISSKTGITSPGCVDPPTTLPSSNNRYRYIRIFGQTRATAYGFSIYEIQITQANTIVASTQTPQGNTIAGSATTDQVASPAAQEDESDGSVAESIIIMVGVFAGGLILGGAVVLLTRARVRRAPPIVKAELVEDQPTVMASVVGSLKADAASEEVNPNSLACTNAVPAHPQICPRTLRKSVARNSTAPRTRTASTRTPKTAGAGNRRSGTETE